MEEEDINFELPVEEVKKAGKPRISISDNICESCEG